VALSWWDCHGANGHGTRDDVTACPIFRIRTHYLIPRKVRSDVSVSIKPLEDRILVRTLEAEQTTASGLVIPDTAKEKPQEGEVLAVGPGRVDDSGNRVPLDISVGDKVIYSKYGGTEVKYSGEEYLILSARDVLAVVDK
jgi:chaperonin GroES